MSDLPLPGPLDDFLGNPPAGPPTAELRRALLERTLSMVRRRRWVRRLVAAGSLVAAAVLVAVIVWFATRTGPEPDRVPAGPLHAQHDEKPIVPPVPKTPEPAPESIPPPVEKALPVALAMEWQAFDVPPKQRSALFLQAGDRYVEDSQDFASAVRCYGQAVQTAETKSLEIDPDDNWLVMALKLDQLDRRKEK